MGHAGREVDRYIGQRLRQQRDLHGLLESQVAARLEVKVAQLLLFEDGRERIPAPLLVKAAELFRVSVGWFFESAPAFASVDGLMPANAEIARFLALPEAYPLMKAFIALGSAEARQTALARISPSHAAFVADDAKRVKSTFGAKVGDAAMAKPPANDPENRPVTSQQHDSCALSARKAGPAAPAG